MLNMDAQLSRAIRVCIIYACDVGPGSRGRTKSSTLSRRIGLSPHPHAPTLLRGHARQILLLITDAFRRLLLALRDPDLLEVDVSAERAISGSPLKSGYSEDHTQRSRYHWKHHPLGHWLSLGESSARHMHACRHCLLKRWYELLLMFPIAWSQCVTYGANSARYRAEGRVRVATTLYLEIRLLLQSLDLPPNIIAVIAKMTQSIPFLHNACEAPQDPGTH